MSDAQNVGTHDAAFVVSEFTNDHGNPLGKRITRRADGGLDKAPLADLSKGTVTLVPFPSLYAFAEYRASRGPSTAFAYGVCEHERARVTTQKRLAARGGREPAVARDTKHFKFRDGFGLLMLDYDPADGENPMPAEGFVQALRDAVPELRAVTLLWAPSASSCIYDSKSNEEVRGISGQRIYLVVTDARRIPEVGRLIFDRTALAGHGAIRFAKNGRMLDRSIVDAAVWQAERLDFIRAECGPGLVQRPVPWRLFCALDTDGEEIDAGLFGDSALDPDALAPLTDAESKRLRSQWESLRRDAAAESVRICAEWAQAKARADAPDADAEALARRTARYERMAAGEMLAGDYRLICESGECVTVQEILDDPTRWNGARFADPADPGEDQRIAVAYLLDRRNGRGPAIYSHAHGGCWYDLVDLNDFERVPAIPYTANAPVPEAVVPREIRRNDRGKALVNEGNVLHACLNPDLCGATLGFDAFKDELTISHDVGRTWQPLTDEHYVSLAIRLARLGFAGRIPKELLRDVVHAAGQMRTFDSAQQWLNGLRWDGTRRVATFAARYLGADDTPYTRAVSRYLWTALAGRVLDPGCQADMAPVLVGAQGARKSSAVRAIVPAPEFCKELDFALRDADQSRKMRGLLVGELAELKGLASREIEAIKSFITQRFEHWTPKFREYERTFPRRCIFIGTTNAARFLADETGERRWLPMQVGPCEPQAIARDRELLWAEAAALHAQHGVMFREAEELARAEHAQFKLEDTWTDCIGAWLAGTDTPGPDGEPELRPNGDRPFTLAAVLSSALNLEPARVRRSDEMRASKALVSLGYESRSARVGGVKARFWFRAGR